MILKISHTGYWENVVPEHHDICIELCDWAANFFQDKNKQIYDFGCGLGQYCKRLSENGFTKVQGFEGTVPERKMYNNIVQQDLTKPFILPEKGNCLFLEVAEHVPAQYEDVLLQNIFNACDGKLVMSWALRGQGGYGHVNELNNSEAIDRMVKKGFKLLEKETAEVRSTIPQNTKLPWFLNTTLVFGK